MLHSVRRHEARQRNISTLARRLSRCGFGRSLYCKRGCTSCVAAECSHLVSPGAKITLQANHDCGGMMSPPLHTEEAVYARTCSKEGGWWGWVYRVPFSGFPPEYITPPSPLLPFPSLPPTPLPAFKPCETIIQQPPVSSYQWQPDGERTSNTSRLVDRAALAGSLAIVERICGFRLAS